MNILRNRRSLVLQNPVTVLSISIQEDVAVPDAVSFEILSTGQEAPTLWEH
jgi:hypothetical protein